MVYMAVDLIAHLGPGLAGRVVVVPSHALKLGRTPKGDGHHSTAVGGVLRAELKAASVAVIHASDADERARLFHGRYDL